MKKTYQKPEALVEELELQQMIAMSIIEGEADPEAPVMSREEDFLFGNDALSPFNAVK